MNLLQRAIQRLERTGKLDWMSDKWYLRVVYIGSMWKLLRLKHPRTFSEKLQWLKLYDRKRSYTAMVDKYEVKKYVADRIGEEYIIPTLGVWDRFDDIDFDSLPSQFVLKCTHDSGGVVICRDKSELDMAAAKAKLEFHLHRNYFLHGREWCYKNVKPRIIAERYLENADKNRLTDYKFMCFQGEPKCLFLCLNRDLGAGMNVDFYDLDWKPMPFERKYHASGELSPKPERFDTMVELARKLSKDIPFVRVDFYEVEGKVYFGELTFFPGSGMEQFRPEKWDYTLGSWIDLPEKTVE